MPNHSDHTDAHLDAQKRRLIYRAVLIVMALSVLCLVFLIVFFCLRSGRHSLCEYNLPRNDALMPADLDRLKEEPYDGALLSMHAPEQFSEKDFAAFRGQRILVTSHSIGTARELSDYLNCIFQSGNPISSLYLCLDPELLWKGADTSRTKWKKSLSKDLYAHIENHPDVAFEILLPYPYIDYWLDFEEEELETVLTVYHTLVNELSAYPNTRIFFPGIEEWLMVNPDNYADTLFDANEIITNKIFLYTFCDAAYQITPVNEDFFWNSLREMWAVEKASPTSYPDLSQWCLVFFGDSVLGNFSGSFSIPGYASGLSGAPSYNYAIGGTSASYRGGNQDFPNTVGTFLSENVTPGENGFQFTPKDADAAYLEDKKLIFIFNYGFNDYFSGAPVDNPMDAYDISTYKGALRTCISKLRDAFPEARCLIMSPTHTALFGNGMEINGQEGDTLPVYVDAARALAEEMDLYFLDNYNDFVVTEETLDDYLSDGCHPNERGRLAIALQLIRFIDDAVR